MTQPRTVLPWLLLGRHVRPYALAVSVASFLLGVNILTGSTVWGNSGDPWSLLVAVAGFLACAMLWIGYWASHPTWLAHGLLVSAAAFAARGAYIGLVGGNWITAALSLSWTLASGGAYLLEATWANRDDDGRRSG